MVSSRQLYHRSERRFRSRRDDRPHEPVPERLAVHGPETAADPGRYQICKARHLPRQQGCEPGPCRTHVAGHRMRDDPDSASRCGHHERYSWRWRLHVSHYEPHPLGRRARLIRPAPSLPGGIYYPLTFTAAFQSKSRTVAYAISIVEQEMTKMTEQPPSDAELNTVQAVVHRPFSAHVCNEDTSRDDVLPVMSSPVVTQKTRTIGRTSARTSIKSPKPTSCAWRNDSFTPDPIGDPHHRTKAGNLEGSSRPRHHAGEIVEPGDYGSAAARSADDEADYEGDELVGGSSGGQNRNVHSRRENRHRRSAIHRSCKMTSRNSDQTRHHNKHESASI